MDRGNSVANWDLDDPYMNDEGEEEKEPKCMFCENPQSAHKMCKECNEICDE